MCINFRLKPRGDAETANVVLVILKRKLSQITSNIDTNDYGNNAAIAFAYHGADIFMANDAIEVDYV